MFNTISIQVVDITEIKDAVSHDFFESLMETINMSDISFGNNDDTLIRVPRFIELVEEAAEVFCDDDYSWKEKISQEKKDKISGEAKKLIQQLNELPSGVVIALGS